MIEDMKDEDILDKARMEGINQGIWLCIQKLVHMEQYDMAKHFIKSFGFDRNECNRLLDKNGSDDEMESFIARMILDKDDKITLSNIGYHEICSVFKCDIGSKEIELEVIESGNYSCDGCIFNNNIYCCRDTYCIDRDREDNTNVIYKEVKRS